jgi:hypothetical protein
MPVDIILLKKGLHLDFYEYQTSDGIRKDRFLGSASRWDDKILNITFKPKRGKGFLLAVVNNGTESVRISGKPKELRYLNETPGTPDIGRTTYNPVDTSFIVPGTFAVIDLSKVPDLKNAIRVNFTGGKSIEIAWGFAAIYKNTILLTMVSFFLLVVIMFLIYTRKKV